jgi:hypothetical protein
VRRSIAIESCEDEKAEGECWALARGHRDEELSVSLKESNEDRDLPEEPGSFLTEMLGCGDMKIE